MSTTVGLMIVYVCAAVLAAPVSGNYTECQCNVNHALCVNLKCATDTTCQRVTTMTNNRITGDDMFCSQNRSHDMPCYNSALRAGDQILVRYCCGDPYCNANNTYLFEFITSQLGDEVSDLLNSAVTPSVTTITRPTNLPTASTNERSNGKSYDSNVWIVIAALVTIIFITLQVVCVTIVLIIGCRKLK